jgi:surfeit locus 1 family protein
LGSRINCAEDCLISQEVCRISKAFYLHAISLRRNWPVLKATTYYMQIADRKINFSPTLLPTLAALVAVLLTLYLAIWQQGRAAEKRSLQAQYSARTQAQPVVLTPALEKIENASEYRYRLAVAIGDWQTENQIFIDNKMNDNGVVGYHVITPLKIKNSNSLVLVNRGWIARSASYPTPPVVSAAIGEIEVQGQLTIPSKRFLELTTNATQGNVWQNLTIERYQQAMKKNVLPWILLASKTSPPNLGLMSHSERPDAGVEKHMEYMLTWYSLALTVLALWVGLNLKIQRIGFDSTAATKTKVSS